MCSMSLVRMVRQVHLSLSVPHWKSLHFCKGRIASTSEIYQQLSEIASDTSPAAEHPVAILTSEDRDTWAVARDELAVFNADVLKLIDSSIFLVCLDNDDPSTPESLAHSLLHGDGSNRFVY